ncbi:Kinetochore protein mis13 [Fusarium oxysporum f. sp. rapae]|uniref:Kinetochore protein mis13 n=1 Tax=Fusarium oxysporum f. sp. rapae TaxID=485398 RepID=A0A8J5NK46_FUSOX|nr:Kinetochore protein mis13 [Fusarium oxysporum f. sp. rapae]
MSNEHGRRMSKRLAAAAATDYEHDDDFSFVRKSKRIKTDMTDEPKTKAVPEPKTEPVKSSAKGRPATKQLAANAPTTNGTIVEEGPPEKETNTTAKPATRKSSRRKASVEASDAQAIKVPKRPSTRRSTQRSGEAQEEEGPQPAPASIPEPEPESQLETVSEAAPASPVSRAPKKRESRAKPTRPPPDWDKSPQREPPVQSTTIAGPMSDTPIINRNKEMRKKGGNSNRRSSLGNRGRRASSLIESGQTAIPHREVDPAEFYKHIEAEGLTEPRRMKQLLTWCGERALVGKPPQGTPNSNAILGARAIQDQLLKDFAAGSEFSDWFSREEDGPNVPVVLRPNPRNMELDAIQMDGGSELYGASLKNLEYTHGVKIIKTTPYTPEFNGVAERSNRTIFDKVRATMESERIPIKLWPLVLEDMVRKTNVTATRAIDGLTPIESFLNEAFPGQDNTGKPDLSGERICGSQVTIHIPQERRLRSHKFGPRGETGIYLCMEGSKIYTCWVPSRRKGHQIVRSANVKFYEKVGETELLTETEHDVEPEIRKNGAPISSRPQSVTEQTETPSPQRSEVNNLQHAEVHNPQHEQTTTSMTSAKLPDLRKESPHERNLAHAGPQPSSQ